MKSRIAIYLANILDHFDSALYGFMVPILAPLFFPNHDPLTQLIQGYGIFLLGIITRPLGAWYFSKLAQTQSPAYALIKTIQGIAIATVSFSLIQTYELWGVWGAFALAVCKSFQNFFSSGEVSIAGLYILENTKANEQHPISGQFLTSTMLGIGLAICVTSIIFYLPEPKLYWRWPFYGSAITAIVSWWLRRITLKAQKHIKTTTLTSLTIHWPSVFKLTPITGLSYIFYSAPMIFFSSFAAMLTNHPIQELVASNNMLMVVDIVLLLLFGKLFKNQPAYFLLRKISMLAIILIPAIFLLTPNASFACILSLRVGFIMLGTSFCIPLHRYYLEIFPPSTRYINTALGYAIGSEVFGRSFPAIGLFLWHITGVAVAPALYISVIAIISVWMLKLLSFNKNY